jgi:hypothetical protein
METCDCLSGEGLTSCYAQFGCDVSRVRAFYAPVAALESLWETGEGVVQHTTSLRGATMATMDEDEYVSNDSPAPWWPLGLPPMWS